MKLARDMNEEKVLEKVFSEPSISKYLINEEIKKKIFIPNKLINIII